MSICVPSTHRRHIIRRQQASEYTFIPFNLPILLVVVFVLFVSFSDTVFNCNNLINKMHGVAGG